MKVDILFRSFRHALRGLTWTFRHEQNFRIQLLVSFIVVCAMIFFPLTRWERLFLLSVILLVLVLELLNTSMEYLIDLLKPRLHEYVGNIKDVMAGAVLLASLFAVIIGVFIFWPYFWNSFFA